MIAVRALAIITTNANAMMAELHDRKLVILEGSDWPTWLGEVEDDPVTPLKPSADDVLRVWPVSRRVDAPWTDGVVFLDRFG